MTPKPDEISICDKCGCEFGFSTGVAVMLFLCPECYNRDKQIELIKEWRAECEKRWTPHATPNAVNRREAIIYNKCADQLEKLVGEIAEKSKTRKESQ